MTSPWPPDPASPSSPPPSTPVVAATTDDEPAPPPAAPKKTKPGVPKWEAQVRDRLRHAIRKLSKPLEELVSRDANEGDTRHLVTDLLVDGLGYDKYEDLTTEYQVKVDFADYGVRIDKQLVAFVEVKRCTQKLNEKHLRQVQMYAVNEGVEWMMLTNGQVWQAYHLTGGLPVIVDMALEVDLLAEVPLGDKVGGLFFLTKESLKRRQIDDLWAQVKATSPQMLAQVVLSDPVVEAIRKELRRQTGQRVECDEVRSLLSDTVLRADALEQ